MDENRTIILDFSKADSVREVHELLKKAFGFPEYYGRNWDALHDCLGDFCSDGGERFVEIHGFYSMDKQLRISCAPMLAVFGDVQEEMEQISFTVVS